MKMTSKKLLIWFLIFFFSNSFIALNAYASNTSKIKNNTKSDQEIFEIENKLPWNLEIGLGYENYEYMYHNDGNSVLTRIGIGKKLVHLSSYFLGLEIGVQNGNTGRLDVDQATLDSLGGLPIEATIKPSLDLLITNYLYLLPYKSTFIFLKAGPILRQLQFTRGSINDLTKVSPEIQLGIGADINRMLKLSLAYQKVISKSPNFEITSQNCSAHVSNIPSQSGIILGTSIILD